MPASTEGFLRFRGARIWYGVWGRLDGGKRPLVCVGGGPGLPHDYLEPLTALWMRSQRPVVLYDTLGSGRSERVADRSVDWQLSLLREELEAVCGELALREAGPGAVHLFGHSSGGLVAIELALAHPELLRSLTLSSTPADIPAYLRSVRQLLASLPAGVAETVLRREEQGLPADVAFLRAYFEYVKRHVCRTVPLPEPMVRAGRGLNREAHQVLKGGDVLYLGRLRDWNITGRLHELRPPTLITCGRHDPLTPAACAEMGKSIAHCELQIFEQSSHMPHLEEPEAFLKHLASYLDRQDAATT